MKTRHSNRLLLISIVSVVLTLSTLTAIASTRSTAERQTIFDVISKIFIDGELISAPHIVAYANQKALVTIGQSKDDKLESLKVGFVAKDVVMSGIKDAIGISYDILYYHGMQKMHSKPKIIVKPNQEARLKISSDSGHDYEMYVVAKRRKA